MPMRWSKFRRMQADLPKIPLVDSDHAADDASAQIHEAEETKKHQDRSEEP